MDPKLRKSCATLRRLEAGVKATRDKQRDPKYQKALAYRRSLYEEFGGAKVREALKEFHPEWKPK